MTIMLQDLVRELVAMEKKYSGKASVTFVIGEKRGYVTRVGGVQKSEIEGDCVVLEGEYDEGPMYKKVHHIQDSVMVEKMNISGRGTVLGVILFQEIRAGDWLIWEKGIWEVQGVELHRSPWRPGDRVGLLVKAAVS